MKKIIIPPNRNKVLIFGFLSFALFILTVASVLVISNRNLSEEISEASESGNIKGELIKWYPMQIDFEGIQASESDTEHNPFLDYKLEVEFIGPNDQKYTVQGFFNGDGNGGSSGKVWSVRFSPDEEGVWKYSAKIWDGDDVAFEIDLDKTPIFNEEGNFEISKQDNNAPGFLKWGRLEYVGEHYLKFKEGPYFIKGGVDSPENLLGYAGFDNTVDTDGDFLHKFETHRDEFEDGEPDFSSAENDYDSKGIIGALNYLSSKNINSVYFLPMNLGGDAQDTHPFLSPDDKLHYDISKLDQWNMVFEHAMRKGIQLHVVLGETEAENRDFLDGGDLGMERKLFYKELVARFGHNLAIKWNIQEETNYSSEKVKSFANYISDVDPYNHSIATHTGYDEPSVQYDSLIGEEPFTSSSIQYGKDNVNKFVEEWRIKTAEAGRPWVIDMDENAVDIKLETDNIDQLRKEVLYPIYLSGGNIEWYMEPDQALEDFSSREDMWKYMWAARKFMQENLPFWEMNPADDLHSQNNVQVFSKAGIYALYFPSPSEDGNGELDLSGDETQGMKMKWYNPRNGAFQDDETDVDGGSKIDIPGAPDTEDWVLLITDGSFDPADLLIDEDPSLTPEVTKESESKLGYQEKDGLVVIEAESLEIGNIDSAWEIGEDMDLGGGYTGDGYLVWKGETKTDSPNSETLETQVNITNEGEYKLAFRSYQEEGAEGNNLWVKVDDGDWIKVFSKITDEWTWNTYKNDQDEEIKFNLKKGVHSIQLSTGLKGINIDRFHLYTESVEDPIEETYEESEYLSQIGEESNGKCIKDYDFICDGNDLHVYWDDKDRLKEDYSYEMQLDYSPQIKDQCSVDGESVGYYCGEGCEDGKGCDDRLEKPKNLFVSFEDLTGVQSKYSLDIVKYKDEVEICREEIEKIDCKKDVAKYSYCGSADDNGDNKINLNDFEGFKKSYNKECVDEIPSIEGCGGKDAIINGKFDGLIDIKDFDKWIKKYQKEDC